MAIWNKINGVWRQVWTTHVKIDGVWRNTDVFNHVNGVWRTSHIHEIQLSNVIGFKLIYRYVDDIEFPAIPHLVPNKNIPVDFDLTGSSPGMNTFTKGVIFHYSNKGYEEGIKLYAGTLYAILDSDQLINVSSSDLVEVDEISGEGWHTNRIESLTIQVEGYTFSHPSGYVTGWNSLFDVVPHWDHFPHEVFMNNDTIYPIGPPYNHPIMINPISLRSSTYMDIAAIGIARNLTIPDSIMVGSYGVLDHTIDAIRLNGIAKPFAIEIFH